MVLPLHSPNLQVDKKYSNPKSDFLLLKILS